MIITELDTQTVEAENVTAAYGDTGRSVSARVTEPATGGGALSYKLKSGGDFIDVDPSTGALTIKKPGTAYVTVTAAGGSSKKGVKTGDDNYLAIWIVLLLASAAGTAVMALARKK